MNVITRGIRNAFRSPVRSVAIIAMLAISIGLILAMLVARTSVNTKISEVKAITATQVTINPAGIQGLMGGGDPLTADQVKAIASTQHIASISSNLMAQMQSTDTNLKSSLEGGKFRIMRGSPGDGQTLHSADSADGETKAPTPPRPLSQVTNSPAALPLTARATSWLR